MVIKPAIRNFLRIIADLSHYDWLIKMLQPIGDTKEKTDDQTFRILNITKEGLEELHPNQQKIKQ